MSNRWTAEKREKLELLLREGFKITKIAKLMGISSATIYSELKRTLSPEEYACSRFIKYSAERAVNREIELATKRIKGK